ncbi:flavoprotein [Cryptosporidium serpentis]
MIQYNLLVGVSGSVAAIKTEDIIKLLTNSAEKLNIEIITKIVITKSSAHFFNSICMNIISDEEELNWKSKGDPIIHIELRKWADMFIILPLSANTLGKLANGLCDNLLTNIARAWDFSKPIIVFPAMNTMMWSHPITDIQINKLKSFGFIIVEPIYKKLACGEEGFGALPTVNYIVDYLLSIINKGIFNKKKE